MKIYQTVPTSQLINGILDKCLKNGKPVVQLEDSRRILTQFRDFNPEQDWMESKDYTKLLKILSSQLSGYATDPDSGAVQMPLYGNILYLLLPHQLEYHRENAKDASAFARMESRTQELASLGKSIEAVSTRLMRNGKLPKEEADKLKKIAIKGAIHPILKVELTKITEDFRGKIESYFKQSLREKRERAKKWYSENIVSIMQVVATGDSFQQTKEQRSLVFQTKHTINLFSDVTIDGCTENFKSDTELDEMAATIAANESESFFFKMSDKLGGLISPDLESADGSMSNDSTGKRSYIHFAFKNGSKFSVYNNIVLNWSPLGTGFYQYPTTFYNAFRADGTQIKNVNEASIKEYFKK